LIAGVQRHLSEFNVAVCGADGTQTQTVATALRVASLDDPRQLGRFLEPRGGRARRAEGERPAELSRDGFAPREGSEAAAGAAELRAAPGGVVWLAADVDLPPAGLRALVEARCPVLTTALPSAELASLLGVLRLAGTSRWALERPAPAGLLQEIGEIWSVQVELGVDSAPGGLGWRLFDAVDLIAVLLEPIENVLASMLDGAGRPQGPARLRGLTGICGALLRDRRGRPAVVSVGCCRGVRRRVTIVGEHGVLALDDLHARWCDRDGHELDRVLVAEMLSGTPRDRDAEIAAAIREAIEGGDRAAGRMPGTLDGAQIALRVATCEAMRVSAITGAAESVSSMLTALTAARL
jgi:hypothetical protein